MKSQVETDLQPIAFRLVAKGAGSKYSPSEIRSPFMDYYLVQQTTLRRITGSCNTTFVSQDIKLVCFKTFSSIKMVDGRFFMLC